MDISRCLLNQSGRSTIYPTTTDYKKLDLILDPPRLAETEPYLS